MEERDYEADALKMGHVSEEEWKGDPDKWRPAKEFVERGENIVPILKDRVTKLEADLAMTIKLNKESAAEAEKRGFDSAKKDYDKTVKELKQKQVEAVKESDVEEFEKIEKEIVELEEPTEVLSNPVFEDWNKKNEWYGEDKDMTEYAEFVGSRIQNGKNIPADELEVFYGKIKEKVKATFPDKFKNKNREKPDLVGGGSPSPAKSKNTFSDLPDEAKSAFNRLKKQFENKGRELKKEDYVKTYFEEE